MRQGPAGPAATWGLALLGVVFATLALIRVYWGADRFVDVLLWDESIYLARGADLAAKGLTGAQSDAFLYALYYRGLLAITGDPVAAYLVNYAATPFLVAALLVVLLVRTMPGEGAMPLIVPVFLFAIAHHQFMLWPRISVFLAVVVLAGLLVAERVRDRARSSIVLALAMIVASYVRQEMLIAAALALVHAVAVRRTVLPLAGATVLLVVALATWPGHPALETGERQSIAMAQHLAARIVATTGVDTDPLVESDRIVGATFGPDTPWWRWPLTAPAVVADHLAHNLAVMPREAARFLAHPPLLLPSMMTSGARIEAAAIGVAIAALFGAALVRRRSAFTGLAGALSARLAVVAAPGLVAAIVLYPHQHYLFVAFVAALVLIGTAIGALRLGARLSSGASMLVALGLLAATPTPFTSHLERRVPAAAEALPTRATIAAIRGLGLAGPYVLIADGAGLRAYLPGATGEATLIDKGPRPFAAFLAAVDPDVVVYAPWVGRLGDFRSDASLAAFLDRPLDAGFRPLRVPGADRIVFVHRRVSCARCP